MQPDEGGNGSYAIAAETTTFAPGKPISWTFEILGPSGRPRSYRMQHERELPGAIPFMIHAPSAGIYRLFLQFLHGDAVRTVEFTVEAAAQMLPPRAVRHDGNHAC